MTNNKTAVGSRQVLLVEDDARLATLTANYLRQNGFEVALQHDGDLVLDQFRCLQPDIVILDLSLPGKDGVEICAELRTEFDGPIIMMTARSADIDQVIGLENGADDYIVKPVEPVVLVARLRALLRRARVSESGQVSVEGASQLLTSGDLTVDRERQEVRLQGNKIELTTHEFDLLSILINNTGKIISREELFRKTRGIDYDGLDRSIDVRISRLRKKLGDDSKQPVRIKTIWGKGYLFSAINEA